MGIGRVGVVSGMTAVGRGSGVGVRYGVFIVVRGVFIYKIRIGRYMWLY